MADPHGALDMRAQNPEATAQHSEIGISQPCQQEAEPFAVTTIEHEARRPIDLHRRQKILVEAVLS